MTTIKQATPELKELAKQIAYKTDLLKDIKESNEKITKLQQTIKDAQEEIKALLAASEDYLTIEQEKKELEKELKEGAKNVTKGTGFKASVYVQYLKAKVKEEAVEKVVQKGMLFRSLDEQAL